MLSRMQRRIGRLIPMPVKAKIRTLVNHRRSRPIGPEAPSSLQIGTFAGFEVAYRKGTADENVISESFGRDTLFPRVPEYQPDSGHVIIDVGAHWNICAIGCVQNTSRTRICNRAMSQYIQLLTCQYRTEQGAQHIFAQCGSIGSDRPMRFVLQQCQLGPFHRQSPSC